MPHDPLYGAVIDLLEAAGESPDREGLQDTPERFAKAWRFITGGRGLSPNDVVKTFEDGAEHYDGIVFQGRVPVYSTCEHHLLTFFGVAHIGYIPKNKIIGLSKFARVVDIFSRRLQVQERLTRQIADFLSEYLEPVGVGVVLKCRHMCMESRGVQLPGTTTHTSSLLGAFRAESAARSEFMQLVASAEVGLAI